MSVFDKPHILKPALYIVPTPIGNIDDITIRGLKTLRAADLICCEDTRVTGNLLKLYGITPRRLASVREHNEARQAESVISSILDGKSVAYVSDAGTPLMSDPGARLVAAAIEANIDVIPLPGATAFAPALTASGIDCSEFIFVGFPPHKKGRSAFIKRLAAMQVTSVIYESPHRIAALLAELAAICNSERQCCIAREITKLHEEIRRGTISDLAEYFSKTEPRGEFVAVLEGNKEK